MNLPIWTPENLEKKLIGKPYYSNSIFSSQKKKYISLKLNPKSKKLELYLTLNSFKKKRYKPNPNRKLKKNYFKNLAKKKMW